jgi:hypothetical protein
LHFARYHAQGRGEDGWVVVDLRHLASSLDRGALTNDCEGVVRLLGDSLPSLVAWPVRDWGGGCAPSLWPAGRPERGLVGGMTQN